MTTHPAVPEVSTLVEMAAPSGPLPGVRIDDVRSRHLVLSLPDGAAGCPGTPAPGDAVTLRWSAGPRGRYVVTGTVVGVQAGSQVAVDLDGEPQIEQNRQYVRGGGGEHAWLLLAGAEVTGWVQDISERGIRVRFGEEIALSVGQQAQVRVELGNESLALVGEVLKTSVLSDTGSRLNTLIEVVVVFDADEARAQSIRRYVLQQQLQARARLADA